jgi:hypothetical protein
MIDADGDFQEFETTAQDVYCPYCGEKIVVIVDQSVLQQEYIEDCSVCCRPITLTVSVGADGVELSARHENE